MTLSSFVVFVCRAYSLINSGCQHQKNRIISDMLTHAVFLVVLTTRETMFLLTYYLISDNLQLKTIHLSIVRQAHSSGRTD